MSSAYPCSKVFVCIQPLFRDGVSVLSDVRQLLKNIIPLHYPPMVSRCDYTQLPESSVQC